MAVQGLRKVTDCCGSMFIARTPSSLLKWNVHAMHKGKCVVPFTLSVQRSIHTDERKQCFPPEDYQRQPKLAPHFRAGNQKTPSQVSQASSDARKSKQGILLMPNPVWEEAELYGVSIAHRKPRNFSDRMAYFSVQMLKFGADILSGYIRGKPTEKKWLRKIIFIESFSAVPGWVAATTRHIKSFYKMQKDHGWLHTFLEESENERMHLMTAFEIHHPSLWYRFGVLAAQGVYVSVFFISYLISPRYCHRFVGYTAEEAVKSYTELIKELDEGVLPLWSRKAAPDLAIRYWHLAPEARIRDVVLAIRADKAHHRDVNHTFSDIRLEEDPFPHRQTR